MHRRVLLIVTLLLTGAALNVAVAEALGWFSIAHRERLLYVSLAPDCTAEVFESHGFGKRELSWRTMEDWAAQIWQKVHADTKAVPGRPPTQQIVPGELPGWCSAWSPECRQAERKNKSEAIKQSRSTSSPLDIGIGWPLISLSLSVEPRLWPVNPAETPPSIAHGGAVVELIRTGVVYRNRAIAWHPVWPAFILNTCFYALLTWSLIRAPRALRRWRRRRTGRCIACGYDLKGLVEGAVCPECGSGRRPGRS